MTHLPDRLDAEVYGQVVHQQEIAGDHTLRFSAFARGMQLHVDSLGARLLDLLFPARCVNCKKPGGALCEECFASIQSVTAPFCARCNHPLRSPHAACPECRTHPRIITRIRSAAWHEGAVREAIHALKYNRRRDVVPSLTRLLAQQFAQLDAPIDFLTSVPLYPAREQERGYNQAELLAEQTARMIRSTHVCALRRTRVTADQIGLNASERRANVRDAFAAVGNNMAGANVVLIDDVCTTGATLDACAAALFANGARTVYGLTVARPR